jgi:KipI family sensor histidine kinase inhibitor
MLLFELEPVVDTAVNRRAIATAAAVRSQELPGVRDVRATYRSVAVDYDPLTGDRDVIASAITSAFDADDTPPDGRYLDVPVVYGGADGPDLPEVAERSGLSPAALVAAHSAPSYQAFMLGFMPGFPYLGPVAPAIVAPRRSTPRLRVGAGSVGIAGRQTGVYPRDCPGGWAIVGRTDTVLFDPSREPAALVRPGDRVRFVPVDRLGPMPAVSTTPAPVGLMPSVTVLQAGLLTTVQDEGRWGHQAQGVPVGGALDARARRAANGAVGNAAAAAVLEVTLSGFELRFDRPCVAAVSGADLGAHLDSVPVTLNAPVTCRAGSLLRFVERRRGARAYVALAGGVDVPPVLGSRSTELGARFGGFGGRALRAGDQLAVGGAAPASSPAARREPDGVERASVTCLRVLPGPHDDWFDDDALASLERGFFAVTPQSNRVGYRLAAQAPLPRRQTGEMISDATVAGGIQVPPDGQPILLMADRQVTGGYPILATVITADMPLAAQLAPGDAVAFEVCSRAAALAALREHDGR